MPGTLRPDAHCPVCGDPLLGLTDETSDNRVTRRYFHAKVSRWARRVPCIRSFPDVHKATAERRGLEVDTVANALKSADAEHVARTGHPIQ